MKENTKEYELLRQEIMQYLEEYQSLRNMMYIITVTLLGFCLKDQDIVPYVCLLPLIVTIPSYLIYIEYYNSVVRDATYLIVFYERNIDFPIKWETRFGKYRIEYEKQKKIKINCNKIPYLLCTFISILLYLFNMDKSALNILIGLITIVVSFFIFVKCDIIEYSETIQKWETVKQDENKTL